MSRRPRKPGDYPANQFCHEVQWIKADQISGGFGAHQDQITPKCVFPAFEANGEAVSYRLKIAFLLFKARVREHLIDDINAAVTIKGIGNCETVSSSTNFKGLAQSAAKSFIGEMSGLSGSGGIVQSAIETYRKVYQGVNAQRTKNFAFERSDGAQMGGVSMRTKILNNDRQMRKALPDLEYSDDFSRAILTELDIHFTAEEVLRILEDATNVPKKYGQAPRLIFWLNYPVSLFSHQSREPQATCFIRADMSTSPEIERRYQPVEIAPISYEKE